MTANDAGSLDDESASESTADTHRPSPSDDERALTPDGSGYGLVRRTAVLTEPVTDVRPEEEWGGQVPASDGADDADPSSAAVPSRIVGWRNRALAIGAVLVALILGVALGFALEDPTESQDYKSLAAERDDLKAAAVQLESEISQLESDVSGLQNKVNGLEEEVAGVAEREAAVIEAEEAVATREAAATEQESSLAEREAAVGVAEEEQVANSFPGSGTYRVGTDIQPGTYAAAGSDMCYWARLSDLSGELSAIITNHIGSGPQVVTIRESDAAFETTQCGTWTKQ